MCDVFNLTNREHQVDGTGLVILRRIIECPCADDTTNVGPHHDCESQ